jgi:hypothetical protein
MATFDEAIAEQKKLLAEAKAEIKTLTEETFAGRREQLQIELQGVTARIEAEKAALEEAKARGEGTKEIEAEISALQKQMRDEQKSFNDDQSKFQEEEEKKAKKRHAKSIRRIAALKSAYESVKSTVSEFVGGIITATLELEKQSQQFRKSTGGAMAFTDEISQATRDLAIFGGSSADAAAMVGTLNSGFFAFQRISADSRKEIIGLTTRMSALGVGADVTAGAMDQIMGTFRGTTKDVEDFAAAIAGTAENMGMDPGALGKETLAMSGRLAELGPRAMGVALEFQKMGRQFGVNAESLLGFSDKFETFESAQDTVAQLNASFGTQLNTLELMKMSEVDRAKFVMDNLKANGQNFDQLSKFQRRNLAEITGLEVAELSRLNQNREAFETEMMQRKEQEERGKSYLSLMEKIRGFFQKMVLNVAPLVTSLIKLGEQVLAPLLQRSDNISKVYFDLSTRIFKPMANVITHIGKVLAEKVLPLMDMTGGSTGKFGEMLVYISEVVSVKLIAGIDYLANTLVPKLLSLFNSATGEGGFVSQFLELFRSLTSGGFAGAFEKIKKAIAAVGAALVDGALSRLQDAKKALMERKDAAVARGKSQAMSGAAFGGAVGLIGGPVGALIGAGIGAAVGGIGGLIRGAVGSKQKGGYAGGMTMVGEAGPEMLSLPRGSYVTNNEMLRAGVNPPAAQAVQAGAAAGGMGGQGVIHLYMDSRRFASAVINNINEENTLTVV